MASTLTKTNWTRMRQLAAEVEQLKALGRWNIEEYCQINREAVAAGGDAPGARDWLLQEADPAWRDQLVHTVQ
jgi:phage terminase small subunit